MMFLDRLLAPQQFFGGRSSGPDDVASVLRQRDGGSLEERADYAGPVRAEDWPLPRFVVADLPRAIQVAAHVGTNTRD
jgi:hypothetical protein